MSSAGKRGVVAMLGGVILISSVVHIYVPMQAASAEFERKLENKKQLEGSIKSSSNSMWKNMKDQIKRNEE